MWIYWMNRLFILAGSYFFYWLHHAPRQAARWELQWKCWFWASLLLSPPAAAQDGSLKDGKHPSRSARAPPERKKNKTGSIAALFCLCALEGVPSMIHLVSLTHSKGIPTLIIISAESLMGFTRRPRAWSHASGWAAILGDQRTSFPFVVVLFCLYMPDGKRSMTQIKMTQITVNQTRI